MKKITAVLLIALFVAFGAVSHASAASALKLTQKQAVTADPLLDYSSFVKIKFEKYNDIIDKFFRTVKRNYLEKYDNYKEMMDMIQKDGSYYVDRA
ncbi:MAG TPA: hypothetical protein PK467_18630 [Candidatus Wallbacteria bacterium]|nr:hypothetical protein [Candidatus Wallbacteria bacterium]